MIVRDKSWSDLGRGNGVEVAGELESTRAGHARRLVDTNTILQDLTPLAVTPAALRSILQLQLKPVLAIDTQRCAAQSKPWPVNRAIRATQLQSQVRLTLISIQSNVPRVARR